ncbi:hypothetical protein KIP69_10660 [Geobacter sulfurreducens]|uniref:DUF1344 domain-containing protein n=1 Tax=Geobacter sulfurreducens (strain ATCC 51573 / DSM 12127 / PCA) TaxID=243231 RepID=Q74B42_GEOSL|nr:hypothetical protein [Geobacter sulfurreducens]AAR35576.1 hypothetical protein GSU2200 [Geobacter sulfurreducens PCA]ADI84959.1 hypothetical protein KN400_2147 [Geobacter sulfurreducens KN400]AJY68438.1 hypothetical protein RW64_01945 [Geobacter sulfurreducens]QVW34059.1 hypothetical protein KIP69_10660 [Geobacter sulfurreducens]UAC02918.1 hypothetical protein KVP06_11080 [Geobacter sulfurreducens]
MKKAVSIVMALALLTMSLVTFSGTASAAEVKMIATIKKIEMKGSAATVTLKDTKSDKTVTVTVKDELTLDKFKDKRIVEGDEIRLKYDDATGESKLFRKTAGC